MNAKDKRASLEAAEQALASGKIVKAAQPYEGWKSEKGSGGSHTFRERENMLAANLALLADDPLQAGIHISELKTKGSSPCINTLRARLSLLEGNLKNAIKILNGAVGATNPPGDLVLQAALVRERGLVRLEAGDIVGGQADLAEAMRLAMIAGDHDEAASAKLDLAESALDLDDLEIVESALPSIKSLSDNNRLRAETIRLRAAVAAGIQPPPLLEIEEAETIEEANYLLAAAGMHFEFGDKEAGAVLDMLEGGGWTTHVASIKCESALLRASIALKESRATESLAGIAKVEKDMSPGIARRFQLSFGWLRIRANLELCQHSQALRVGRKLLREVERQRAGISALSQLRRLSHNYRDLYLTMVSLELRHGKPEKAYDTLQQFSARALLRLGGHSAAEKLERSLSRNKQSTHIHKDHAGSWAIRKVLRGLSGSRFEPLRWNQLISVLKRLDSD